MLQSPTLSSSGFLVTTIGSAFSHDAADATDATDATDASVVASGIGDQSPDE